MILKESIEKINTLAGHARKARVINKKQAALIKLLTGISDLLSDRVGVPAQVEPGQKKKDAPGEFIEYEEVK